MTEITKLGDHYYAAHPEIKIHAKTSFGALTVDAVKGDSSQESHPRRHCYKGKNFHLRANSENRNGNKQQF